MIRISLAMTIAGFFLHSTSALAQIPHSVTLTWQASTTPNVTYNIYRSNTSGSYSTSPLASVPGTSYTDYAVQAGQTYFYVVKAVDSANPNNLSAPSNEAPAMIPTTFGPLPSVKTDITLIASNPNPSVNSPVTYIFRVTGGSPPPQGTVTVTQTTNGIAIALPECTLVPVSADPGADTSSGSCRVSYDNKDAQHGAGVHQLTAMFTPVVGGGWTNATSNTVTVGKPTTSVSQPTVAPGTITFGTNATFSAVVTPTHAIPNYAALSVQFYDNVAPLGTPVTPNAATGVASYTTTTPLSLGNHNITAQFIGDANYSPSPMSPSLAVTVTPVAPAPKITVMNSASNFSTNFAPDSFASIFGVNLANTQLTATTPYPTSLGGTSVNVTDSAGTQRPAPVYFVSTGQVNLVIPANTAPGQATITVTNPSGVSTSSTILITPTSPGIFSADGSGKGVAAALVQRVKPDNSQVIENVAVFDSASKAYVPVPIVAGVDSLYLQLYGTGIRHTASLGNVACTINGIDAQVLYASMAPDFEGPDQVNVKIPDGLTGAGTVNVVVTVDGQTANVVTLTFGK